MSTTNMGMWKSMGISYTNSAFKHPSVDRNIHVLADVPHLIKLIRNNYLDHGFVLKTDNGDKFIGKDIVQNLLMVQSKSELRFTYKVTDQHLNVHSAQRQKVKITVQLFSRTVSKAIQYYADNNLAKSLNWKELNLIINNWFDLLNSQHMVCDNSKAYGLDLERQNELLARMDKFILSMKVHGKQALMQFQKGILMTNYSLRNLYEDLKLHYNIQYIITRRLNQDVLENFCSFMRAMGGCNDHPTHIDFKYR
ncbi:hypothetical protein QTP88_016951 [Uroleucon formosanum]